MANKKNNLNVVAKPIDVEEFDKKDFPIFLYLLAGLVAILPLVISADLFDAAVANRLLLITIYCIIFFGLFIFLKPKITFALVKPVLYIIGLGLLYIVWSIIATINAINPIEGLLEISKNSTYFLFFITVIITVLTNKNAIEVISSILVIVALLHSFVGIAQYYDFGGRGLPGGLISYPYGFNANRNFYGSFMAMLIPFCAYVFYIKKNYWQYIAGFAIVVGIGAITISQTRAAWISTFIMLVFVTIGVVLLFKAERILWLKKIGLLFLSAVVFIGLLIAIDAEGNLVTQLKDKIFGTVALVQNNNNAATAEKGSAENNAAERIDMIKKSIPIIKDNPILGVGRNNWKLTLGKYGLDDLKAYSAATMIPDFPHNVYIYIASETGIVGLLMFLGFIFGIVWLGIKALKTSNKENKSTLFLLAGLMGVGIDCLFSFSDSRVEHMMLFGIIIGGIVANYLRTTTENKHEIKLGINKNILAIVGILILCFNTYVANCLLNFDKHFLLVSASEKANRYADVLTEAEACRSNVISMGGHVMPVENLEIIAYKGLKKYAEAEKAFADGRRQTPYLAQLYNNMGTSFIEGGEPEKAKVVLQNAIKIAPLYVKPKQNLAIVYYNKQQFDTCFTYLKETDIENPMIFTDILKTVANDYFAKDSMNKCLEIIDFHKKFKSSKPWFDSLNMMVQQKIKK